MRHVYIIPMVRSLCCALLLLLYGALVLCQTNPPVKLSARPSNQDVSICDLTPDSEMSAAEITLLAGISEQLASADVATRRAGARALYDARDNSQEGARLILQAMADPDSQVAIFGAKAAGWMRDWSLYPGLIAMTDATHPEDIRVAGASALALAEDGRLRDRLIELLDDPDVGVQMIAFQTLGEMGDPTATPAMLKYLQNHLHHGTDAYMMVSSIGEMKDARAFPLLSGMLTTCPVSERGTLITAIGKCGCPQAVPVLSALLNDPDKDIRSISLYGLGTIKGEQALDAILACTDADPGVKDVQIMALRGVKDPRAIAKLRELAQDADENVKEAAVGELLESGAATEEEIGQALGSGNEEVVIEALVANGKAPSPEMIPQLRTIWATGTTYEQLYALIELLEVDSTATRADITQVLSGKDMRRTIVLQVLALVNADWATEALVKAAASPDYTNEQRLEINLWLANRQQPGAPAAVAARWATANEQEKCLILSGLIPSTDPDYLTLLTQGLHDKARRVRATAVLSMRDQAGTEPFQDLILAAGSDPSATVRCAAVQALARVRTVEAEHIIVEAAHDPCPQLRDSALWAMGSGTTDANDALLIKVLQDTSATCNERRIAANALGQRKATDGQATLLGVAMDKDEPPTLREAAIHALGTVGDREAAKQLTAAFGQVGGYLDETVATTLTAITGANLGVDRAAWERFFGK